MTIGPRHIGWLALAVVVGAGVGLLLGRERAEALTAETLGEARALWAERGPSSYLLELEIRGALDDTRRVEVRDGKVVRMTTGGSEAAKSAWEHGSVEALFDALATEISNANDPQRRLGVERVALLARFDPEWGYPSYFYRHIMGSPTDVEWEVVRFEPR